MSVTNTNTFDEFAFAGFTYAVFSPPTHGYILKKQRKASLSCNKKKDCKHCMKERGCCAFYGLPPFQRKKREDICKICHPMSSNKDKHPTEKHKCRICKIEGLHSARRCPYRCNSCLPYFRIHSRRNCPKTMKKHYN